MRKYSSYLDLELHLKRIDTITEVIASKVEILKVSLEMMLSVEKFNY